MIPALSYGEPAPAPAFPSLGAAILSGADRLPDGNFISYPALGPRTQIPWPELVAWGGLLADGLLNDGLRPGEALVIRLTAAPQIAAAIYAAAFAGFVAVPMTSGAHAAPAPLPEVLTSAFTGLRLLDEALFHRLTARPRLAHVTATACNPNDLRVCIATSGTTGKQRLVGLSDSASLARWWPKLPQAGLAKGFLSWASFDHVMGIGLTMPDLPSKTHLATARFIADPLSWLDAIVETGTTHATMTSFGLGLITCDLARNSERRWDLSHVLRVGVGAEMVQRATCEQFLAALAPFGLRPDAVIAGYGMSECGPVAGGGLSLLAGTGPKDAPPELDRPTMGHAIRIVSPEGALLAEGEPGAIEVCGPTMTLGYLGDPEANAALFTKDNWLRTGDLGLLREGRITVLGREKEQILINARKFASQEIEAAIRQGANLAEVYVSPVEGAATGAPFGVFVLLQPNEAEDLAEIASRVRAATASRLRFAPAVVALIAPEDLPRTSLGKVRRLALTTMLAEGSKLPQDWLGVDPQSKSYDALIGGADRATSRGSSEAETAQTSGNALDALPGAGQQAKVKDRITLIWQEILGIGPGIDPKGDFYALGGDSLSAVRLELQLAEAFGRAVDLQGLGSTISIEVLTRALCPQQAERNATAQNVPDLDGPLDQPADELPDWCITRQQGFIADWPGTPALPGGFIRALPVSRGAADETPLFWCIQHTKGTDWPNCELRQLGPLYLMRSGLQLFAYGTPLSQAMARRYAQEISQISPTGPLILGGSCQGATLMAEVMHQLLDLGREVRLFVVADAPFVALCDGVAQPVPVALIQPAGSKFNPGRWFRTPEIGLQKLAPKGLFFRIIPGRYSEILHQPSLDHLTAALTEALAWVKGQTASKLQVPPPSTPSSYAYKLKSPVTELDLVVGERFNLPMRLTNQGSSDWLPFAQSGLAIGNHWLSEQGEVVTWADARHPIERPLGPDEAVYLTLKVQAPPCPGAAILEIDVVEEGVRWFGDATRPPLQIPVRIHVRGDAASTKTDVARLGGAAAGEERFAKSAANWSDGALKAQIKRPKTAEARRSEARKAQFYRLMAWLSAHKRPWGR